MFVYSNGSWTLQAHLFSSDTKSHQYGSSVAIDGNTIVVGARWDTTAAGDSAGSACNSGLTRSIGKLQTDLAYCGAARGRAMVSQTVVAGGDAPVSF